MSALVYFTYLIILCDVQSGLCIRETYQVRTSNWCISARSIESVRDGTLTLQCFKLNPETQTYEQE